MTRNGMTIRSSGCFIKMATDCIRKCPELNDEIRHTAESLMLDDNTKHIIVTDRDLELDRSTEMAVFAGNLELFKVIRILKKKKLSKGILGSYDV